MNGPSPRLLAPGQAGALTGHYGFFDSCLGAFALAAALDGTLLAACFAEAPETGPLEACLRRQGCGLAPFTRKEGALGVPAAAFRALAAGQEPPSWPVLALGGTSFQRAVWQALVAIPRGQTRTYGELAAAIGRAGSARAVGRAVGANPLALLLPCHRVVTKTAAHPGGYAWGLPRKRALLDAEQAPMHERLPA